MLFKVLFALLFAFAENHTVVRIADESVTSVRKFLIQLIP
jgi:hypothetical protein